jgi:hypothetical protein
MHVGRKTSKEENVRMWGKQRGSMYLIIKKAKIKKKYLAYLEEL